MSVLGNELAHNCWGRQWDGLCGCLSNGHPVDQRDSNGLAPLQICAGLGWTSAVSKLLKHGADVHLTCPLGWTALMQAVRNGHTDTAVVLLDAGAKIAHRNALGWDVLSLAISSNNYTLLTKLVHMAKTSDLSSALAMACQMGNIEAVKLLLNYEADVNQKLPNSELTPLMLAASGGHETIVEILLHHRANPHLLSSYKLTAFDMAFENRQDAAAALLSCFKSPVIHNHLGFPVSPHYFHNNQNVMHSPCLSNELLLNVRSPILPSSTAKQASPQVFKFPESPNFYCVQNGNPHNVNVISPYSLFPHSPAHFFPPLCHCGSPSFVSSPIVPSWMFSSCLSPYTGKTKPMVKKTKRIKIWWKKLKLRCNRKGKKLRVEVHMTVDQDRSLDDQKFLELLSLLNLDSLAPLFKRHEIDAETFRHLGKKDLEEMGILDQALQLSILKKISILNRNNITCGAL